MNQNCKSNYEETGKAKQICQPFLLHLAVPICLGGLPEPKLNKLCMYVMNSSHKEGLFTTPA